MEDGFLISAIELQKKKKDRYNIYADGEYIASLSDEAVVSCGLRVGAEISVDALSSAVEKDNAAYAFTCAAQVLSHGMRTRFELEQKLKQKGIEETAIQSALDKLESYGYVNDAAYAKEYVQSMMEAGSYGRKAVEYRLKEKGVNRETVAAAMEAYTEQEELRIAREKLRTLPQKGGEDARKRRQTAGAALARHGFSYDVISTLFSEEEP